MTVKTQVRRARAAVEVGRLIGSIVAEWVSKMTMYYYRQITAAAHRNRSAVQVLYSRVQKAQEAQASDLWLPVVKIHTKTADIWKQNAEPTRKHGHLHLHILLSYYVIV